jgi:hypothetical protein
MRSTLPLQLVAALALVGALLAPTLASADPLTSWTAGPDAILDDTYDGFIDVPAMNTTVPTGNFTVTGWFLDRQAEGWSGADSIQLWLGTMGGSGKLIANALVAQPRPDVAAAENNPFWVNSGFSAVVPFDALPTGAQTLSIYAHTPGKGWWYKQVNVNVSGTTNVVATSGPPAAASAGAGPILVIEAPNQGTTFSTRTATFSMMGYAVDPTAAANQGSQGSGIDQVTVYADNPREKEGIFLGTAALGFEDSAAAAAYGTQFVNSGWRFDVSPTSFHSGVHNLYVYAHSVVTNTDSTAALGFSVTEAP